jgi:2-polyprenyl-3-methyl-5-hydroxy-6-metoxy-1,4-benzoquinol methylase
MEIKCRACSMQVVGQPIEFAKCQNCGTFNYVSTRTAEDDNKEYFNSIFSHIDKRVIDEVKKKYIEKAQAKDRKLRHQEMETYDAAMRETDRIIRSCSTVLDVGFGGGSFLLELLRKGSDAYGIDLSEVAVARFKGNNPDFASRVRVSNDWNQSFACVYNSALFEHLDSPLEFLRQMQTLMTNEGYLIIDNIPVSDGSMATYDEQSDICFWKPCHRAIYSIKGLEILFGNAGLHVEKISIVDSYNYRLLSTILACGYADVVQIRDPRVKNSKMPGRLMTWLLSRRAIKARSLAKLCCITLRKKI